MRESLLRHFPWRWALHWLIAPNLALVLMWPVGGPPMGVALMISGCLGLLLSQLPWTWPKRLSAIAITLAVVGFYVLRNFNFDPGHISALPTYLREADPLRSPLYVAGMVVVVTSLYLSVNYAPLVPRFKMAMHWMMGFLAVIGIVQFDTFATASTRGSYDVPFGALPFTSAVMTSGHANPHGDRRNFVVIVVESLGVPTSPAAAAQFKADWDRPEWRSRYAVHLGDVPYFGATTNGEMRELCGLWSFTQTINFAKANCLPDRYKRAGYETTAMHAFTGNFFDREKWWKSAGFDNTLFRGDLERAGARACGGVFPGACDVDLPTQIGQRLKNAKRPQLVYWVTLNSHLPVIEDASIGTENCTLGGDALAAESPRLCPLFQVHHQLADALTRLAMDPALPPTDFLIVGDHMPPFFERSARVRYDGHHVPWILLEFRAGHSSPTIG